MLKSLVICCVWFITIIVQFNEVSLGESETDKGVYNLLHIGTCPNHEAYPLQVDITKEKVNRTHYGFTGWLEFDRDLTDQHAVKIDIYKQVDGGSKHFYVLTENSFCGFCEKYAKDNLERMLAPFDRTLPLCPITKGRHELAETFCFDFNQLPEDGIYGTYDAYAFVHMGGVELGCLYLSIEFKEKDEESEEEEE